MKRTRQSLEELLASLSIIETTWKDALSQRAIEAFEHIGSRKSLTSADIASLLEHDFDAGILVARLFLDLSKDEFQEKMKRAFGTGSQGKKRFEHEPAEFVEALNQIGVLNAANPMLLKHYSWIDILTERLKNGRGSAIKGQRRGRYLEDFTEAIVRSVFSAYDVRCKFTGKTGISTEKADFAIPGKNDPRILIEVKAYGATGSKQTDVLGDIAKIVEQKRHDTALLLVTDGTTWESRKNDLRSLVKHQHDGSITRIYTQKMQADLSNDLQTLKKEYNL